MMKNIDVDLKYIYYMKNNDCCISKVRVIRDLCIILQR